LFAPNFLAENQIGKIGGPCMICLKDGQISKNLLDRSLQKSAYFFEAYLLNQPNFPPVVFANKDKPVVDLA
jgi:hypothetical protein